MQLESVSFRHISDKAALKKLYQTAFPQEERMPWWVLKVLSCRKDMGIFGFYEGNTLRGFTAMAAGERALLVLFFAVPEACRGQGWGSRVLSLLKQRYPGRQIVLNVELLDPAAKNYAQRLQRLRFYKRNGFFDTGYDVDEVGGTFRVLSTEEILDVPAYLQAFGALSYGFWRPYVRKGEEYGQRTDA